MSQDYPSAKVNMDYHSAKVSEVQIKFQDGSGFGISPYQIATIHHRCYALEQELSVARKQIENLTELAQLWKQLAESRKQPPAQ